MFIKYSTEQRLTNFTEKGEMYFSPARIFREIEEEQKIKGQGDKNDSGLHSVANTVLLESPNRQIAIKGNIEHSILVEPANNTPAFCLKYSNSEYITQEYYQELSKQFPQYTHALIIDNEEDFLENIRFSMRSRAFAHSIFYQDNYSSDFIDFLYSGTSDIHFYPVKRKGKKYYAHISTKYTDGKIDRDFFIDDSNYFKTMFRKDTFFQNQSEYRIVLPHEQIEKGKVYFIQPFRARILSIDSLIKENIGDGQVEI